VLNYSYNGEYFLFDLLQLAELGQIILNLVSMVPNGIVVFLPSYSFLSAVKEAWGNSGLMDKFGVRKKVRQCCGHQVR
jgi:chromosome transmission fidelity protein 1